VTLVLWPKAAGTATPTTGPQYPDVPTLYARIAWRDDGFTQLTDARDAWSWTTDGSAISGDVAGLFPTTSNTFGGGTAMLMTAQATASSGIDMAIPGTAVSGREYTFRVGLYRVSGGTDVILRAGNASDPPRLLRAAGSGRRWTGRRGRR